MLASCEIENDNARILFYSNNTPELVQLLFYTSSNKEEKDIFTTNPQYFLRILLGYDLLYGWSTYPFELLYTLCTNFLLWSFSIKLNPLISILQNRVWQCESPLFTVKIPPVLAQLIFYTSSNLKEKGISTTDLQYCLRILLVYNLLYGWSTYPVFLIKLKLSKFMQMKINIVGKSSYWNIIERSSSRIDPSYRIY